MFVASAPLRISLLGGGSDYPEHYKTHGGNVFGFGIKNRSFVSTLRESPELAGHEFKIGYRNVEEVNEVVSRRPTRFRLS